MLTVNKMYPPEIGGVEVVAQQIAEFFDKERQTILCFNKTAKLQVADWKGIPTIRLPGFTIHRGYRYSPRYHSYIEWLSQKHLIRLFHYPSMLPEIEYALHRKRKGIDICLYHADTDGKGLIGRAYRQYGRFVGKAFLAKMDWIVATSPNIVESSDTLKIFKDKCKVIPLGVDTTHFYYRKENVRKAILDRFDTDDEHLKIVLFVGRAAEYKGIDVLLRAIPKTDSRCRLVIISNESLSSYTHLLKSPANSSRVKVIPFSLVGYDRLPEYYSASDVFTMPSTDRGESFGLVALEAMACGTPVITTELGTGTSFANLDGITGRVIPPNDPEALAKAIDDLVLDQSMSRSAIMQRAADFSLISMRSRWTEFIGKIESQSFYQNNCV